MPRPRDRSYRVCAFSWFDSLRWGISCGGRASSRIRSSRSRKVRERSITRVRELGEPCDDGNNLNGDGCNSICFREN
ncbi:MAG: hypothetical protein ABW133_05550 [Polyangiaceae bacterium]